MATIQAVGKIDNDGKLQLFMGELKDFFKKNAGKKVVLSVETLPEGTKAMTRYYWSYVVPRFRQAMFAQGDRLTPEEVDELLRESDKMLHIREGERRRIKTLTELSKDEFYNYLEWLKQLGAEVYSIIIDDPE